MEKLKVRIGISLLFVLMVFAVVLFTACIQSYYTGDMFTVIESILGDQDTIGSIVYSSWQDVTFFLNIILFIICSFLLIGSEAGRVRKEMNSKNGIFAVIAALARIKHTTATKWIAILVGTAIIAIIILMKTLLGLNANDYEWFGYMVSDAWRDISGLLGVPMIVAAIFLFLRPRKFDV